MNQRGNGALGTIFIIALLVVVMGFGWHAYKGHALPANAVAGNIITADQARTQSAPVIPSPVTHIPTPAAVKGIYISGWSAGTPSSMVHINTLLDGGTLNSVVIDIKDATGRLSYEPLDPTLLASGVGTKRIAHLATLIQSLHAKHIYVIGRIEVFQDQYYPTLRPKDALQDIKTGGPWKDPKGLEYLQANNPDVWHYTERIAEDAYAQGFDEINLDYVRFPSDGKLKDIDESTFTQNKEDTIATFFTDVDATLRQKDHIPLSADIFGLTLSATDDMGIGQKLELIAPHVDYVCPMIYPSHFAPGSYKYKNPADHPYDVIHHSLTDGIAKLSVITIPAAKLRPWLQDFNLGAVYTATMVQDQITATNDVGLDSWLMWDASNKYTSSVYK
ncbi:MAG: hypothetical protein JWM92_618 [Candidatus Nomurabacteria bacterium]|nr:hypothetical protein [Candidatus Nomurabacteria bacterium]